MTCEALVSVPFRGSRSEIRFRAVHNIGRNENVSVPFRGSRSEISAWRFTECIGSLFPSPFGVHVLKSRQYWVYENPYYEFPSPFGVHVLKFKSLLIIRHFDIEFPSPFGVHVLKYGPAIKKWLVYMKVSVPFRGSRSEIGCV